MHHFWVTFTIGAIEKVQNLLFKSFTVFVNCLSSLNASLVIERSFVWRWSNHLLSVGEIDFFRDNHEPSQDDSHLAAALLPLFLQGVKSRNIVPRELIVVVYEIVSSLCPFAMLVDGFKLLALLRVRFDTFRRKLGHTYSYCGATDLVHLGFHSGKRLSD